MDVLLNTFLLNNLCSLLKKYFLIFLILTSELLFATDYTLILSPFVDSVSELSSQERAELLSALVKEFSQLQRPINKKYLSEIKSILNAGIFEEQPPEKIAKVCVKTCLAVQDGAPREYVEDIAQGAFQNDISAEQISTASKLLVEMSRSPIPSEIYQEMIAIALRDQWTSTELALSLRALASPGVKNIDCRKLALAIIIFKAQHPNQNITDRTIQDEIHFLQQLETQRLQEADQIRSVAYSEMIRAVTSGIPEVVARELYVIVLNKKWSTETIKDLFTGMIEGHQLGLTPQKLALAMIIRLDQGLRGISVVQMIQEEIRALKKTEKERHQQAQQDPFFRHSLNQPLPPESQNAVLSQRSSPPSLKFMTQKPSRLNLKLMQSSLRRFLGVPYMWGGASPYGMDCSGLVQNIYREQGILLPRVSRQQFQIGQPIPPNLLQFGDLIFFNKYGYGYANHVGIYIGDGQFIHASASKGVIISRLNKLYFRARFIGARRIV